MTFALFLLEAAFISLSGVMAPGPITTVTVGKGSTSPRAGALIAVGHGIVEFPLMIAVFYGVGRLFALPYVKVGIAVVGSAFLLMMGVGMLRSARQTTVVDGQETRSPLVAGILLTAGNPYFLIWWATVGATLIARSMAFGVLGFAIFAVVHWLCDLTWDSFLSVLSFKGGQFFGKSFQKVVFAVCGVALIFFSGKLAWDAVGMVV